MLKNIIKISIRLFLVFTIFQFISLFTASWAYLVNLYGIKIDMSGVTFNKITESIVMDKYDIFRIFLQFIIIWCINLTLFIILWIKSEKISELIIGKNNIENIEATLGSENILSISLCIVCTYFIIDNLPKILHYVSNYIIFYTKLFNENAQLYISSHVYFDLLEPLIKIIISVIGIRYREKIIKKIFINNKDKPNNA
ncbi:MAG: hypothetical protein LBC76_11710 [Treponema sp.]|jgi:hypothetical protein|nr:hypothetical protein [Treponema sp.]